LELKPDGFELFHGNYDQYLEKQGSDYLERRGDKKLGVKRKTIKSTKPDQNKQVRKTQLKLEKEVQNKERAISRTEQKIAELENILLDAKLYQADKKNELAEKQDEVAKLKSVLGQQMNEWEEVQEKLELVN
jgi:chromosome segregation ATPase